MTPDQIRLVQTSFDDVFPVYRRLTEVFYTHLFARAPDLRRLFRRDMEQQKAKFANMLAATVAMLDQRAQFRTAVYDMGLRHVNYGVGREHFEPVGTALLDALAEVLGPRFTPAAREAWLALFDEVRSTMIEAMSEAA